MRRVSSALIAAGYTPDGKSSEPLHRQLYRTIRGQILAGALQAGDRLPSTRALAKDLQLGRNTVTNAFEQLAAEGYLETERGSGTYVAAGLASRALSLPNQTSRAPLEVRWSRWARQMAPENLTALAGPLFRPFQPGLPDVTRFPGHIWTRLFNQARRSPALLGYGSAQGYLPLRRAIAAYVSVARGVICDSDQIVIVSGTQQGLDLIARLLLDPGDSVLVENPGYIGAHAAFGAASARLVPVSVDSGASTIWETPANKFPYRLAYLTPSNQFPTGGSMGVPKRLEWLRWAKNSGTYLVEDDYDGEFRYDSRPLPSMQGLDSSNLVIYIGSFSKLLFPSLRLGYLVLPRCMVPSFATAKTIAVLNSPLLEQATLAEFIENGHFGRHIRRMRALYKERLATMAEALRRELPNELAVNSPEAGMHICIRFSSNTSDVAVCSALQQAGLSAMPLSACYLPGPKSQGLLLGFAAYTPKQIKAGVRKLAQVLRVAANRRHRTA